VLDERLGELERKGGPREVVLAERLAAARAILEDQP
jgi:hypothetical protein